MEHGQLRPPAWARGDAIAWAELDSTSETIPVFTPAGLWFTLDAKTGKEIVGPPAPELSDEEWVARLHELADTTETRSKCYFIGSTEGHVKIGHSRSPEMRLRDFQLGCPVDLAILALRDGGYAREAAYHAQFDEHRVRGEWFARHPDILAEIERLSA